MENKTLDGIYFVSFKTIRFGELFLEGSFYYTYNQDDTSLSLGERIDNFHKGIIDMASNILKNDNFDIGKIKIVINSVSKLV